MFKNVIFEFDSSIKMKNHSINDISTILKSQLKKKMIQELLFYGFG
jgi:hypothetical protein